MELLKHKDFGFERFLWKDSQNQTFFFFFFKDVTHSDDVSRPAIITQVMISQVLALSMAEGFGSREEGCVLLCA